MIRALTILAAIVALTVSAAPATAGTPEAAKGACNVPGFMDYTDDSCMSKPRWGSAPASGVASGFLNFGITETEGAATRSAKDGSSPGLGVTYFKGELVGIEP
jgi:hypothetical protein